MEDLIQAFGHLEKICNEMYGQIHGVSEYIKEMESTPIYTTYQVGGWEEDLRQLKRLRYIRNCLSHGETPDEDYTDDDIVYLNNFYDRIMHQEDPLALLRKSKEEQANGAHNKLDNSYSYFYIGETSDYDKSAYESENINYIDNNLEDVYEDTYEDEDAYEDEDSVNVGEVIITILCAIVCAGGLIYLAGTCMGIKFF